MVEIINSYRAPVSAPVDVASLLNPEKPFDVNFCFPVKELETAKLKLVPFVPALHLELYQSRTLSTPEVFRYVAYGPFRALGEAAIWFDHTAIRDPACAFFAIIDKTKPSEHGLGGAFAGALSLLNASRESSQAEIGHIMILPAFQRTHVNTHAVGLLLQYVLELPAAGGLGLRRAQWRCNSLNERSSQAAKRMGFKLEGIERWNRIMPVGKEGHQSRAGDPFEGPGRHSCLLSICWDDWEDGVRKHVDEIMNR